MKLTITHETHYEYSAPLQYALQQLCLTPSTSEHQQVLAWTLSAPARLFAQRDAFGNASHSWSLTRHKGAHHVYRGSVCASGSVVTRPAPVLTDGPDDPHPALYLRATALTEADLRLVALGREHLGRGADADALLSLAAAVRTLVPYRAGVTGVATTAAQALTLGAGVCQDQAQVFIAACRAAGWPARYVSGYFHSPQAPQLASHAWADVCVDLAARRWLSVDVTHDGLMDERHVRLAVGPDYAACAPVRGVREGGGDETMRVNVRMAVAADEEEVLLEP